MQLEKDKWMRVKSTLRRGLGGVEEGWWIEVNLVEREPAHGACTQFVDGDP